MSIFYDFKLTPTLCAVFIDKSTADNWGALEVVERWHQPFSGAVYSQLYIPGE
jgi:hypothetical protein